MAPSKIHRILFLNDVGFQYGAGVAQARQVQSFLKLGWEVGAMAWEPGGIELEDLSTIPIDPTLWLGIKRVRHLEHQNPMSDAEIMNGIVGEVARFNPDTVIVGNLHAPNWPLQVMTEISNSGYRVIAYLHDGYLFSGRCAYPGTCRLYLTGCDESCPTAEEYPPLAPALIPEQWRLRRQIFNGPDGIEVAANSHWTRDMFKSALPDCRRCETVYLGADENVFCPGDKMAVRRRFGLPDDKPVVLCAAVNFAEKRKGSGYLQEIISKLKDSVTFVALGHNAREIHGLIGLGHHIDPREVAAIYQAADIFLGTATEEAFGQTVLEAQLCGLPVVTFQAGGVSEIVRGEITGKFVRTGDADGAVAAIQSLLNDRHSLYWLGLWARQSAAKRFPLQAQAEEWSGYLAEQTPCGTGFNPPTITYEQSPNDVHLSHRPSWPSEDTFVNEEHRQIFERTSSLPGWQMPGDSLKLYEMGFHAGDVILEIGTYGGRSATVELRGALANPNRKLSPQFYGIDISPESIARTRQTLADQNLIDYCHLFEGTFAEFVERWRITPTMVFLDGDHRYEGVAADLVALSRYLKPGTPVLMHDFLNPENDSGEYGVRRAAQEWSAAGHGRLIGCFGCTALYLTQAVAS